MSKDKGSSLLDEVVAQDRVIADLREELAAAKEMVRGYCLSLETATARIKRLESENNLLRGARP